MSLPPYLLHSPDNLCWPVPISPLGKFCVPHEKDTFFSLLFVANRAGVCFRLRCGRFLARVHPPGARLKQFYWLFSVWLRVLYQKALDGSFVLRPASPFVVLFGGRKLSIICWFQFQCTSHSGLFFWQFCAELFTLGHVLWLVCFLHNFFSEVFSLPQKRVSAHLGSLKSFLNLNLWIKI